MNVEFEFDIDDRVQVVPLQEPGRVVSCMISIGGCEYRVAYWFDGECKLEWLRSYDLKKL